MKLTVSELARRHGINLGTLRRRIHLGWPLDIALSAPSRTYRHGHRCTECDGVGHNITTCPVLGRVPSASIARHRRRLARLALEAT
jgi:hypothetical protein